jgi:hypothetical protein
MRCDPPVDLKAILDKKIEEARWVAVDAANNTSEYNPDLLMEWKNFLIFHPEIKQTVQNIRPLLLLKYYIDRYISWRFKR